VAGSSKSQDSAACQGFRLKSAVIVIAPCGHISHWDFKSRTKRSDVTLIYVPWRLVSARIVVSSDYRKSIEFRRLVRLRTALTVQSGLTASGRNSDPPLSHTDQSELKQNRHFHNLSTCLSPAGPVPAIGLSYPGISRNNIYARLDSWRGCFPRLRISANQPGLAPSQPESLVDCAEMRAGHCARVAVLPELLAREKR